MRSVSLMLKAIHAQESKAASREKAKQVADKLREMKETIIDDYIKKGQEIGEAKKRRK